MLNQSQAGGATDGTQINSWLENIAAMAKPSGLKNSSSLFANLDESGIEAVVEDQKDDSLEWAAKSFPTLLRQFSGQWILIKDHQVIASAIEPTDLLRQAIDMGIEKPFMLHVEPSTAAQRDAFAAW